ncbi:hypothetical protein A4G28_15365 [Mycobacterium ostraviense]|uniref:Uncharacterized protein n=1 Tax=Mycobacterium ostraviense TaxID=2738409 RepID=A0A162DDB3_9MYCO|nr:hypothetical protein A4G28_15365 [Mycobacterium ostraviense]
MAVAVLSAAAVLAAVKLSGNHSRSSAAVAGAPSAAVPSPGPFTGTYRGDYDAATGPGLDGQLIPGAKPSTTTWGVRSVCRNTGCVATAARLGGETTSLPTMVFDDVGGHWLAVGLATDTCQGANAEFWVVMMLQPRPDGTLAGEISKTSANGCAIKKSVTFTRTGDVDVTAVSDPASQAPRVVSPAEGTAWPLPRHGQMGQRRDTQAIRLGRPHRLSAHRRAVHELFSRATGRLQAAGVQQQELDPVDRAGSDLRRRRHDAGQRHRVVRPAATAAGSDHAAHRARSP